MPGHRWGRRNTCRRLKSSQCPQLLGEAEGRSVHRKERGMSYALRGAVLVLSLLLSTRVALGFCGFYVAKADTQLFNKASKVALVRHEGKTVMTMANDYRGDPQEFALVVPVPTFLERDQIHVGEKAVLDHLDAYSAPRLVEYFDENPCRPRVLPAPMAAAGRAQQAPASAADKSLGVPVQARYTVGAYDFMLLSADRSNGLGFVLA